MDGQLAIANVDLALFEALAPTIAVLAGDVIAEFGLLLGGQFRIRVHAKGADQFAVHLIHAGNRADDLAAEGIVLVIILHQVAVEGTDVILYGFSDNVPVTGQFLAGVRDALGFLVAAAKVGGISREEICGQSRIKFNLHTRYLVFRRTGHGRSVRHNSSQSLLVHCKAPPISIA